MNSSEVSVYTRRWLLLAATCLWSTIGVYFSYCFSTTDQLFGVYFKTGLDQVDWLVLAAYAGTTIVTPVFAYLCHAGLMGFRRMSIVALMCLLVACVATILVVHYPVFYLVLIPVNFLHGVAYCVSVCVMPFFPVVWFPDNEVSIAIAFVSSSLTLGVLLGSLIPPVIIKSISHEIQFNKSIAAVDELNNWRVSTHDALLWMFSSLAVILFLLLIYIAVFAQDLPPKPPTYAMLLKRSDFKTTKSSVCISLHSFLVDTKLLFKNTMFLLGALILALIYNISGVEILHISQLVGKMTGYSSKYGLSSTVLSSLVIAVFSLSGVIAVFFSAKVLQKYKGYSIQTITGTGLELCGGIIILFSYHYDILSGMFVGNFVLSSAKRFAVVPLMAAVTRHTYPMDEAFVSAWLTGMGAFFLVVSSEIARIISDRTTPGSAVVIICVVLLIAFVMSLFFKPIDQRQRTDAETHPASASESIETTPLLTADSRY